MLKVWKWLSSLLA